MNWAEWIVSQKLVLDRMTGKLKMKKIQVKSLQDELKEEQKNFKIEYTHFKKSPRKSTSLYFFSFFDDLMFIAN